MMPERIVPAKDGSFTLYKDETAIHSLYNPALEAEKFIASLSLENRDYRCFILAEPGLGYMVPALEKRFPSADIISIHCSAFFSSREFISFRRKAGGSSWSPGSTIELEDFLEPLLPGDPDKIRIVEWRPAAAAYGREYVDVLSGIVEVIRRSAANRATIRNFGRRWLRNSFRNLSLLRRLVKTGRVTRPFVVCAAGPSLERELSALAALQASPQRPFFMAVSSALPCLAAAGILPDIVIATDGGAWALLHLYETIRLAGEGTIVAAALSAALPSQTGDHPALVLSDGSIWQRWLLDSLGLPFAAFPQRGTVSASALDLAFFLSSGPVYISGLDFRHADLVTHCRPYALDRLRDDSANRLNPAYSRAFEREGVIRSSNALSVYDKWFKKEKPKYPRRLYTVQDGLRPGISRGFPDKPDSRKQAADAGNEQETFFEEASPNSPENGKSGALLLLKGLDDPRMGKYLCAELGELLFPDERTIRKADIKNELSACARL